MVSLTLVICMVDAYAHRCYFKNSPEYLNILSVHFLALCLIRSGMSWDDARILLMTNRPATYDCGEDIRPHPTVFEGLAQGKINGNVQGMPYSTA